MTLTKSFVLFIKKRKSWYFCMNKLKCFLFLLKVPRCPHYANAFLDVLNKCLKAIILLRSRKQTNVVQCLSLEMKIQQIKYYWGWCHSHKCMKIRKTCFDLPKLLLTLNFQLKMFNNFSVEDWFFHTFPDFSWNFPIFQWKNSIFQRENKDVVRKSAFRHGSYQYHFKFRTVCTLIFVALREK